MGVHIDNARRDDQAAGVDHLMSARRDAWLDPADPAIDDLHIGRTRHGPRAVNERATSNQDLLRHRMRLPDYSGHAMPFVRGEGSDFAMQFYQERLLVEGDARVYQSAAFTEPSSRRQRW
jgi:hypothetical protein